MTVLLGTADLISDSPTLSSANSISPIETPRAPKIVRDLSGVVVNQNQIRTGSIPIGNFFLYQEFKFPHDYPRGTEQVVPELTGIQVCVNVAERRAAQAALDYRVEYRIAGYGWVTLVDGVAVGASQDLNEVWFNVFFPPQNIDHLWDRVWRFGVKSRSTGGVVNQEVEYSDDKQNLVINNEIVPLSDISPAPLDEGQTYPFTFEGDPSIVTVEGGSGKLLYSSQQGVEAVWATAPNPLASRGCKAKASDGVTPLNLAGQEVSLLFRVLAATADSGRDFLGNDYRGFVVRSDQNHIDPLKIPPGQGTTDHWLSKPNPTRFAVECLYFDVRRQTAVGKVPTTIESILMDPLTPGVWFNVYWSNTPDPGIDETTWDHLLWTPVPKTFQMKARAVHELPQPVVANFIMIEFTQLQGRYYSPSKLLTKMAYKLFPQWVSDYYTVPPVPAQTSGNSTTITYDAHDLLYNIYDDTRDAPLAAQTVAETSDTDLLNSFVDNSTTSLADPETLTKVKVDPRPFLDPPFAQGRSGDILQDQGRTEDRNDYSTEQNLRPSFDNGGETASEDLDGLKAEKMTAPYQFYKTCRHYYKEAVSPYHHSRAFFVGVNQVALLRQEVGTPHDTQQYRWVMGDNVNIEQNDLSLTPVGAAARVSNHTYLSDNLYLNSNLFLS